SCALAFGLLPTEPLDFRGSRLLEGIVQRSRLDLMAVHQDRVHARQRLAGMFIIVAEKFEMTGMNEASFTLDLPLESGNPFVDQTRRRRIVADDNKDRRNSDAGALPLIKLALVVIVERIESGREQIGKPVAGIELPGLAGALLRH